MKHLLILSVLLAACGSEEGWVTYENPYFGYSLEIPADFEARERLIEIVGEPGREYGLQTVNLVAWDRDPRPIIEVRVNGYEAGTNDETIYVYYDFMLVRDGTVKLVNRSIDVPENGYSAARARTVFADERKNAYSFDMALEDNSHEPLFVDVVSSFRLK